MENYKQLMKTTVNGITMTVRKITVLKVAYYVIDITTPSNGCDLLITKTTRGETVAYRIAQRVLSQLTDGVGFWDLKFT